MKVLLSSTTTKEISDLISSLDSHKSLGPNSIPVFILQSSNLFFADKLSSIINLSFETGTFPDLCKVAKVIPIYKKDNPLLCVNYRPISLLPVFSKIFEKSIYSRMYAYLTENNMIYNRQFGFRANHSCNHALISCTVYKKNQIIKMLQGGSLTCKKLLIQSIIKFYVINCLIMVLEGN